MFNNFDDHVSKITFSKDAPRIFLIVLSALVNKMKIYSKGLEKRKKLAALHDIKKNIQYWINMI